MPGELDRDARRDERERAAHRLQGNREAQPGTKISVEPKQFSLAPGAKITLKIRIASTNSGTQEFGEVVLTPNHGPEPALHLPVAFVPQQGSVTLTSSCAPESVKVRSTPSTCTVVATNNSNTDSTVDLRATVNNKLRVASVTAPAHRNGKTVELLGVPISGRRSGAPSIAPGASPGGYVPLDEFDVDPIPIGDEEIINFTTPSFLYNGIAYTAIGVDSNGYLIVGGGGAADNLLLPARAAARSGGAEQRARPVLVGPRRYRRARCLRRRPSPTVSVTGSCSSGG